MKENLSKQSLNIKFLAKSLRRFYKVLGNLFKEIAARNQKIERIRKCFFCY